VCIRQRLEHATRFFFSCLHQLLTTDGGGYETPAPGRTARALQVTTSVAPAMLKSHVRRVCPWVGCARDVESPGGWISGDSHQGARSWEPKKVPCVCIQFFNNSYSSSPEKAESSVTGGEFRGGRSDRYSRCSPPHWTHCIELTRKLMGQVAISRERAGLRSLKGGSKRRSRFTKRAVSEKSSEIGVWAFIVWDRGTAGQSNRSHVFELIT